jgi:hypothetical protein
MIRPEWVSFNRKCTTSARANSKIFKPTPPARIILIGNQVIGKSECRESEYQENRKNKSDFL